LGDAGARRLDADRRRRRTGTLALPRAVLAARLGRVALAALRLGHADSALALAVADSALAARSAHLHRRERRLALVADLLGAGVVVLGRDVRPVRDPHRLALAVADEHL